MVLPYAERLSEKILRLGKKKEIKIIFLLTEHPSE